MAAALYSVQHDRSTGGAGRPLRDSDTRAVVGVHIRQLIECATQRFFVGAGQHLKLWIDAARGRYDEAAQINQWNDEYAQVA